MNVLFKTHQELTEKDFAELWETGLFVFDANVLLDLYRLPENAREDLIKILSDKNFNKRIWLPFQVLLEFINNKLDAIGDQKKKFGEVRKILQDAIGKFNASFEEMTKKLNDLQLEKRHSIIKPDSYTSKELLKAPIEKLNEFVSELNELEKKQPDITAKDALQKEILKIFIGKIGDSFSKEELEKIYKDGESRYKDDIPPGYKDKDKEGFYLFEDKKLLKKYGDLVVWKEIINKAKTENLEYVVFVSGDVKEDWWREKSGKKISARVELLNEIYYEANSVKIFHIYDTSNFMKFAKQYLKIEVKDESIEETKDLIAKDTFVKTIFENQDQEENSLNNWLQAYAKEVIETLGDKYRKAGEEIILSKNSQQKYLEENLSLFELRIYMVFDNPNELLTLNEITERAYPNVPKSRIRSTVLKLVDDKFLSKHYIHDEELGRPITKFKQVEIW